jgi:hypothetical protein
VITMPFGKWISSPTLAARPSGSTRMMRVLRGGASLWRS